MRSGSMIAVHALVASCVSLLFHPGVALADGVILRPAVVERVTLSPAGGEGEGPTDGFSARSGTGNSAITPDGRFVAFDSRLFNLVQKDENGAADIFVRDRLTRSTQRVSIATTGAEANGASYGPDISADGRYVAFDSDASNLVPGDTNGVPDAFVYDRQDRTIERVSVGPGGAQLAQGGTAPDISGDGRYVSFSTGSLFLQEGDENLCDEVLVRDLETGSVESATVTPGGAPSRGICTYGSFSDLSHDGRTVTFESMAHDLVQRDTNGTWDIFVRDLEGDVTERVSVATGGSEGNWSSYDPSISADGRYVAFSSYASNLVPEDANASATTNGGGDIFVHDRHTGRTERISVKSYGAGAESPDASHPAISPDGRAIAFVSVSADLAPGTNDAKRFAVFLHDRVDGRTEIVSTSAEGGAANAHSSFAQAPAVSEGGRHISFSSHASNLVSGDEAVFMEPEDVFVRDRGPVLGVGRMAAQLADGHVDVSGWATFSGAETASVSDPGDDGENNARNLGGEIVGVRAVYRPESAEILLRIQLHDLPTLPTPPTAGLASKGRAGAPDVMYRVGFEVDGETYQARAVALSWYEALISGAVESPDVHLVRLENGSWSRTARLAGSIGTTGEEVRIVIPLSALGIGEGDVLTSVSAQAVLRDRFQDLWVLDQATMPDIAVPQRSLSLVTTSTNAAPPASAFRYRTAVGDGRFVATLPPPAAGPGWVWARACLGAACSVDGVAVTGANP